MAKDPFILVSLEESESKALAQVMSNDTARKILDFLSKEENATESDIAKKLKLPLSTVHYNLQALTKANLVQAEEFHYSEKGKEVLHYTLANKLIIIAPKKASTESFKDKLRSLLPVGLIALATGGVIQVITMLNRAGNAATEFAGPLMMKSTELGVGAGDAAPRALDEGARLMAAAAPSAVDAAAGIAANATNITANLPVDVAANAAASAVNEAADSVQAFAMNAPVQSAVHSGPNIALWFILGAAFTIVLLTIWYWFVTRKNRKEK